MRRTPGGSATRSHRRWFAPLRHRLSLTSMAIYALVIFDMVVKPFS